MTRTIFVDYVQDSIKNIYDLVLKNQLTASKEIEDGANTKTIAKIVEGNFRMNDYELPHALGHGVGLEIHECPILSVRSERTLKEGMIVTNEPGIYIPGKFGVRIEDTILVEDIGNEVLTKSNKDYCIVG